MPRVVYPGAKLVSQGTTYIKGEKNEINTRDTHVDPQVQNIVGARIRIVLLGDVKLTSREHRHEDIC